MQSFALEKTDMDHMMVPCQESDHMTNDSSCTNNECSKHECICSVSAISYFDNNQLIKIKKITILFDKIVLSFFQSQIPIPLYRPPIT